MTQEAEIVDPSVKGYDGTDYIHIDKLSFLGKYFQWNKENSLTLHKNFFSQSFPRLLSAMHSNVEVVNCFIQFETNL